MFGQRWPLVGRRSVFGFRYSVLVGRLSVANRRRPTANRISNTDHGTPICRLLTTAPWLALLLAAANTASGQTERVDVTVEYLAGANIYIDAGRDHGILDGDTVLVYSADAGPLLGALRVISASADKAVLTFAGEPFPITRGARLSLAFEAGPLTGAEIRRGDAAPERPTAGQGRRDYGPRLTGRLTMDMDVLRSQVRFPGGGLESVDRTFVMPAVGLRATMARLPGDLVVNTNLRLAYRYSSDTAIDPEASARVYEANVGKTFGEVVKVQAGRFYNPFERFSGYWDGVLVRFGGRELGAGFATGFEPERADEGFSSSLPKYTAFVDYRYRAGDLAYDGDVSFHQVRPQNGLLQHTYFGWAQRLNVGGLRLSSDLQLDRDPAGGEWTITELFALASFPLGKRIYVDGRYSRRSPYLMWLGDAPIGERREQAGAGLTYRALGGFISADVTSNRWEDGERSLTYGSSLAVPRTPIWDLGLSLSASYWSRDETDALVLSTGLSRTFGRVDSRVGYQLYRNGNLAGTIQTQAFDVGLSFPLTRRAYSSLSGQLGFGDSLRSQSLRATIWTTF